MNTEYIHKIELSLDHLESNRLSDADDKQLWDKLSEFFGHVCNAVELDYTPPETGDPRDTCGVLFHTENKESQKKFIAVCLLRLHCRNDDAIWHNMSFRTNCVGLFNDQISSIYNDLEIIYNQSKTKKMSRVTKYSPNWLTSKAKSCRVLRILTNP